MIKNNILVFLFIILALFCLGCFSNTTIKGNSAEDGLKPQTKDIFYQEILDADSKKKVLIGYIENSTVGFKDSPNIYKIYYIRDRFFRRVGFVLYDGTTYKYDEMANEIKLGDFTLDEAVYLLLGFKGAIRLESFQPGLGLGLE